MSETYSFELFDKIKNNLADGESVTLGTSGTKLLLLKTHLDNTLNILPVVGSYPFLSHRLLTDPDSRYETASLRKRPSGGTMYEFGDNNSDAEYRYFDTTRELTPWTKEIVVRADVCQELEMFVVPYLDLEAMENEHNWNHVHLYYFNHPRYEGLFLSLVPVILKDLDVEFVPTVQLEPITIAHDVKGNLRVTSESMSLSLILKRHSFGYDLVQIVRTDTCDTTVEESDIQNAAVIMDYLQANCLVQYPINVLKNLEVK